MSKIKPAKNINADHQLKVWSEFYPALALWEKSFEVRQNDRDFAVGNVLELCEYDPYSNLYSGRSLLRRVSYILHGGQFGVQEGYAVLGLGSVQEPLLSPGKPLTASQQRMVTIAQRDGWACHYCGIELVACDRADEYLVIPPPNADEWDSLPQFIPGVAYPTTDHIIPTSRGGENYLDNLVLACVYCNSRKGNRSYEWAKANIKKVNL